MIIYPMPPSLKPGEAAQCNVCGQDFERVAHYTYVRGQRVCRDTDACIERATILPDLRMIDIERRKSAEWLYIREQLAGAYAGGLS
jgi:hypothetical protein